MCLVIANYRQLGIGIWKKLWDPDWNSAAQARSESDCCWRSRSTDHMGGGNPIQSNGHAHRTFRRQWKNPLIPPIPHYGVATYQSVNQSWLNHQDSNIAAATCSSEGLRLCSLGESIIAQD